MLRCSNPHILALFTRKCVLICLRIGQRSFLNLTLGLIFVPYFVSGLKNTQDQIIHLQHIIQLLPLINRDTLYVLLQFLGLVAENAEDRTDEAGNFLFLQKEILDVHMTVTRVFHEKKSVIFESKGDFNH